MAGHVLPVADRDMREASDSNEEAGSSQSGICRLFCPCSLPSASAVLLETCPVRAGAKLCAQSCLLALTSNPAPQLDLIWAAAGQVPPCKGWIVTNGQRRNGPCKQGLGPLHPYCPC